MFRCGELPSFRASPGGEARHPRDLPISLPLPRQTNIDAVSNPDISPWPDSSHTWSWVSQAAWSMQTCSTTLDQVVPQVDAEKATPVLFLPKSRARLLTPTVLLQESSPDSLLLIKLVIPCIPSPFNPRFTSTPVAAKFTCRTSLLAAPPLEARRQRSY